MAGKQKGKEDERFLWPEMLRVIRELAPHWVFGENVPGIINIAADEICADLERAGYEVGIFDYEAAAVGAPHRRERIAFVAHSVRNARHERRSESAGQQRATRIADGGDDVADTEGGWVEGVIPCGSGAWRPSSNSGRPAKSGLGRVVDGIPDWAYEPDIPRVANGIPNRADRLKSLGNAVVPQWAYPIFRAIAEEERNYNAH